MAEVRARTAARSSSWLAATSKGADHLARARRSVGPTFEDLGDQWLDGVERGHIGRRRGKGKAYSETTIAGMRPLVEVPRAAGVRAPRIADEITEIDWQRVDRRARPPGPVPLDHRQAHLGRLGHLRVGVGARRVASSLATRCDWSSCPPNDEKPRLRVALAPEAAALLAALEPEDRLPYAIAFYAGLRRSEIYRLEWDDVLEDDAIATRLLVRRSKSEAGTQRRPPIAANLRDGPRRRLGAPGPPDDRQGRRPLGHVGQDRRARRRRAWDAAGLNRITLHECRHTYASLLMAAGYTIKELMEFMGHADLQMVNRYVKLLPQPGEDDAAERLNDYLRRSESS